VHLKLTTQGKIRFLPALTSALLFTFMFGTSLALAAKSLDTSEPVEPVASDKARVYIGVANKTLSDKWLYEWDVRKLKVQWFGSQNRYYAFNLLTRDGGVLSPLAKFPNNRNKYPHGHYYFDFDPQNLELVIFALNTQNFSTIQGLPGTIKLNLKAGETYVLGYGAGALEGRVIPVNQIVNASLEPSLLNFCNDLRGSKINRKKRKEVREEFYQLGGSNYAKQMACDIVTLAQPYAGGKKLDRMSKWVDKKQLKLADFVEKRRIHDEKRSLKKAKKAAKKTNTQ